MEPARPLIRRDAQRSLSFAIAWFLAIPAFVLGYASILWPLGFLLPHDCLRPGCPVETPATLVPPFFVPVLLGLIVMAVAAIGLYRLTYRRSRVAWRIVAALGVGCLLSGLVVDLIARLSEVVLVTFAWPIAPGLMALDAAWRGRPGASSPAS